MESLSLSIFLLFCLIILYLWSFMAVMLHEAFHVLAAVLVGFRPKVISIGYGRKFLKFKIRSVSCELGLIPVSGYTALEIDNFDNIKIGNFISTISGALFDIVLIIVAVILFIHTNQKILFGLIICWQVITFLGGGDIVDAVKHLFSDFESEIQKARISFDSDILRYVENTDGELRPFLNDDRDALTVYAKGIWAIRDRDFVTAITEICNLIENYDLSRYEKAFLLDRLACIPITQNEKKYLAQADEWSKLALELAPNIKTLQGTRGAILIETGDTKEGKKLLHPLTGSINDTIDRSISASYLAKAELLEGNLSEAKSWLSFAESVDENCEILKFIKEELTKAWSQTPNAVRH